jgi:TRAP-type mannitol/chloroaromatic compound transport system permease large subunit
VPVVTPVGMALGFDPVWFAIMLCVNLQMAFMTPPVASAIFIFKGTCAPEYGISMAHIIKGVIPYVVLIIVGIAINVAFPEIILWLPQQMIRG